MKIFFGSPDMSNQIKRKNPAASSSDDHHDRAGVRQEDDERSHHLYEYFYTYEKTIKI